MFAPYTSCRIRELPVSEQPGYRLGWLGSGPLSTIELIALVLQSTNGLEIAGNLLAHFGTLEALRKATPREMEAVVGIGPTRAAAITAALELGRRLRQPLPERPQIHEPDDALRLVDDMRDLDHEQMRVMALDNRYRVQALTTVYVGNVSSAVMRIAELFREAVRCKSTSILLMHNHPAGDPEPSPEDVRATKRVIEAGKILGIDVLDHIIVGEGAWISLREKGLGFE